MITPEEAIDSINERYGRHPGARALHAKGTVCTGTFTASREAAGLSRAGHLQGEPVSVTARFSNAAGDPGQPDYAQDVRGLAVAFHLPDGGRTDIVSQTAPHFPTRTPDGFIELVKADARRPSRIWRLPAFLATHPEALRGLRANLAALKPPASYATRRYFAIHAFRWVAADAGERHVRYTWVPEAGEANIAGPEARRLGEDYLQDELATRLGQGPIRFVLELQIAGGEDAVDDPTSIWPDDRERVSAGTLEVTTIGPGPDGEGIIFDPMRLTDGIEASEDPILRFRPAAYSVSFERRTA